MNMEQLKKKIEARDEAAALVRPANWARLLFVHRKLNEAARACESAFGLSVWKFKRFKYVQKFADFQLARAYEQFGKEETDEYLAAEFDRDAAKQWQAVRKELDAFKASHPVNQ